jgi:hypothetical protein
MALAIAAGLAIGTAIPTAAIGETQVRLNCSDGTSTALVVDAETLTGLAQAIQAMIDYPAGLTCTLVKVPLLGFGMIALAAPGQSPFIVGGGRWLVPCDVVTGGGGGGGGGMPGAPTQQETNMVWVNIAVNFHQADDGTVFGTLNETIPANQTCGDVVVGETHFTSKPEASPTGCFTRDPLDPSRAYVISHVTQTSGQTFFPNGQGGAVTVGDDIRFSFIDNGNPGQQADEDKLQGPPAFDDSKCETATSGTPPDPFFDLVHGNITLHPTP